VFRQLLIPVLLMGLSDPAPRPKEPPAKELSPDQKQQLKERDRLAAEAQKQQQADKPAEAITAMEKVLVIERQVFGNDHDEVVGSLEHLALLHEHWR